MSIDIHRKASTSPHSQFKLDSKLTGTPHIMAGHDRIELTFTTGMAGGQTDFSIIINGRELKLLMSLIIEAISLNNSKELTDYSIPELLDAVKVKSEEAMTTSRNDKENKDA